MTTKTLSLLLLILTFSTSVAHCEGYSPPKYEGDAFGFSKAMYLELIGFKDDAEFHARGFSKAQPITTYSQWQEALNAARDKMTDEQKRLLAVQHCFSIEDIAALAIEYMNSKGKETDITKYRRNELDATFDLKRSKQKQGEH